MQEIFAVQVLRGMRFPELLEWNDERLGRSYVLPDEALADVVLRNKSEVSWIDLFANTATVEGRWWSDR